MTTQDKQKKLSLIVMSLLSVASQYAIQSYKAMSEEKEIYDQIKDSLNGDRLGFYNYWIFIFYLYNAVYGMEKKLGKNNFTKEEFTAELMMQLEKLCIYSLNAFEIIKNYEGGVTKFIGNRLCKELDIECIILELKINAIFNSYLLHGFYPCIEKAWAINESESSRKRKSDEI